MDNKTLQKLEYPKILQLLTERCTFLPGQELAQALRPVFELAEIETMQGETSEAKDIQRLFPNFTLGGVKDIRLSLRKAEIGGVIEPQEFLGIYDTIVATKRIKSFFSDADQKYPLLNEYAVQLTHHPQLEQKIKKTITPCLLYTSQGGD